MRDPRHRRRTSPPKSMAKRQAVKQSNQSFADQFAAFIAENPNLTNELYGLFDIGIAAMNAGDYARGKQVFRDIASFGPDRSPFWLFAVNNLGACCFAEKQYEEAMQCFLAAVENEPAYTFSLAMLSRVYFAMGERELATSTLQQAEKTCIPENPYWTVHTDAAMVMVEAYMTFGDYRSALRVALDNNMAAYEETNCHVLAVAAFNLQRFKEARKYWRLEQQKVDENRLMSLLVRVALLMEEKDLPPFQIDFTEEMPDDLDINELHFPSGLMKAILVDLMWSGNIAVRIAVIEQMAMSEDPWVKLFLRALQAQPDMPLKVKKAAWDVLLYKGLV
jgi:tetratricopeptide (TPR) repeat protein